MANEPSWEDIFKANPAPSEPEPAQPAAAEPADSFAELFSPISEPPTPPAASQPDSFADLFGASSAPASPPTQAYPVAPTAPAPLSRREARESEGRRRSSGGAGGSGGGRDGGSRSGGTGSGKPKRKLLWLKITLPIVIVLGGLGGVAAYGWVNYEEQIRALLGIPLPTDYDGTGNGEEVIVAVHSGDIGSDVAKTLHEAGVTMTYDAVYDYLVDNPDIGFQPGNWRLQKEMSAESAVAALQDEANKVTDKLLITEGTVLPDVLETIASTTGLALTDVQAAANDLASFGLPAEATSLEGYLFPATYELDGTESAHDILQKLVDTMFQHLDAAGVPVEQRHTVLTMAALVQREGGSEADFPKIARVFQNRIDQDMLLQSDATVAYGTGNLHTVWTTDAERADASNLYNTYVHPGLPIGPIGAPGDAAINAALHPADGPWLYFVPINLATGETVFSETDDEHQAAVDQLRAWCAESPENDSYCE